ncbi:MAG TPA: SpoIIE family protein phosphatase [Tepidisphaeraceae bacterium]|nr:SpoIIE family protein phosphatase [Tepidisphaeraceae bacterium]
MATSTQDNLRLTDFMDLPTLQEIQDSFAAVADVKAVITDAEGNLLTQPTPTTGFLRRQRALAEAARLSPDYDSDGAPQGPQPQKEGTEYVAPIIVNDQRLGTIRMSANGRLGVDESKLASLAEKFGVEPRQVRSLVSAWVKAKGVTTKPAAIQFLFLLANAIARLCFQEFQLRQRVEELTAMNRIAIMFAEARDLQTVLDRTARLLAEVMGVKAASIRLIDEEHDELVIKAVYNLSAEYLSKGPIRLSKADIDKTALGPAGFEYVANMARDPRVQYPQESTREGIVSMLSVGMRHQGKPLGVLRVYTDEEQTFSPLRIDLLKAIGAQAAAAIENARLLSETLAAEALEKQVELAAIVQQRMIPHTAPDVPGLDVANAYVPMYSLGGDLYDFIPLPGDNLGLAIADVSGKGVPASLIMASVRAFLRGQVDNVYYLYEVVRRINQMLCRDTRSGEFVTLFYGVLDARNYRFTYCNAGHPPGLVLRGGEVIELGSDNMVLGVSPEEEYAQSVVQLNKGDLLLLYTDGLSDARNFRDEVFGRQRIVEAFKKGGETAEVVAQNILWEMRKFVGMTKPIDDVTMIVVRVAGDRS